MKSTEQLVDEARNGDKYAADDLIRRFDQLCRKAAGRFKIYEMDRDERLVIARGLVWKAVVTYDASRGYRFITWASSVTANGMIEECCNALSRIGLKRTMQRRHDMFQFPVNGLDCNLADLYEALNSTSAHRDVETQCLVDRVRAKLSNPRHRKIFEWFMDDPDISESDISKLFGVSLSRSSQLRAEMRVIAKSVVTREMIAA